MLFFQMSIKATRLGASHFNRPVPEVAYFHSEIGLGSKIVDYTAEPQTRNAQLCNELYSLTCNCLC